MSSLVKIPLIAIAGFGAWYALTPPQPPPGARERVKFDGVEGSFGSVVRIHALLWKVCLVSRPEFTPDPCSHNITHTPLLVLHPRESPRGTHRLSFLRVFVFFVIILFLLLFHVRVVSETVPSPGSGVAHRVRDWKSDHCRERFATTRMLQDARFALHV
jgi:hypothetical protein